MYFYQDNTPSRAEYYGKPIFGQKQMPVLEYSPSHLIFFSMLIYSWYPHPLPQRLYELLSLNLLKAFRTIGGKERTGV